MALSSKRFVRARISRAKFRQLLKLFAVDLTATQITVLTALNRNTVNRYLRLIRQLSLSIANLNRLSGVMLNSMNLTSVRGV
jgi:hypothetical protein